MRAVILGAVVFVAAAAVLVLEIVAARILAPYVGVTLRSFTAIIGTILAAIAVGAWTGGRLADRYTAERLLGPVLVVGGLLAVITPAAVTLVAESWSGERPATIVALAFVGFFAPAAVLSMVTPIVAKISLPSIDRTGRVVGNLSAIATAGAIFGTFAAGFFLVATFPSRSITWIVGVILVLSGLALSVSGVWRYTLVGSAFLLVAIGATAAVASPCDVETAYFCAKVRVDPHRQSGRELILDTLRHSYVDLVDPAYLESRYTRVIAAAASVLIDEVDHAVFIGGGGFTLPRYFFDTEGASAIVLELDPAIVDLAEADLGLERGSWLTVHTGDARLTMRDVGTDSVTLVVGDAFGGPAVPWHLATVEFVEDVRRVLAPGGIYALNVIDHPPGRFVRAETATLLEVFAHVAVIAPRPQIDGTTGGNYVLIGSDGLIDVVELAGAMPAGDVVVAARAEIAGFVLGGQPLTDAFAPVDQLLGRP